MTARFSKMQTFSRSISSSVVKPWQLWRLGFQSKSQSGGDLCLCIMLSCPCSSKFILISIAISGSVYTVILPITIDTMFNEIPQELKDSSLLFSAKTWNVISVLLFIFRWGGWGIQFIFLFFGEGGLKILFRVMFYPTLM